MTKIKDEVWVVIKPDQTPTTSGAKYKFSDELFDWFYDRLICVGETTSEWDLFEIDLDRTYRDHKDNGCRIYDMRGSYYKLYEVYYLVSLSSQELFELRKISAEPYYYPALSELVNYFYLNN